MKKVTWIKVKYKDNKRFKIAAKHIAYKMDEKGVMSYNEAIVNPEALIEFCNNSMAWSDFVINFNG